MNSQYFIERILSEIVESEPLVKSKKQKQLFCIHLDNVPIHKSHATKDFLTENDINVAPHPPFSPDLAPTVFFLLGALKGKNERIKFNSPNEIIEWIEEKFSSFSKDTLKSVFMHWKERLI